jgi:hypothetical protein
MAVAAHAPKALNEHAPIRGQGLNQIREVLPFDCANLLQAGDGIVAGFESCLLDA